MHSSTSDVIAIVDDDSRVREAIEDLLACAGFAVETFASAEEFLDSSGLTRASCLVLDVKLPGINGLDLQQRVKCDRPDMPVIIITGHADDRIQRRALREGAAWFFCKPVEADTLVEAVRKAIVR
jgi:FixJ family two-component response regulator